MRAPAFVLIAVVLSAASLAEFRQDTKSQTLDISPKQVSAATFRIVQSGTLSVSGDVQSANLTIHIPQDGVASIDVNAPWQYIHDTYGNKLVLLEWAKMSGTTAYRVEVVVHNSAKTLPSAARVGSDARYLQENGQITFSDELRKMAFPYERSMERAAELTMLVHEYIDYDLSLVGQLKPSTWVYENRRGVCVEYANMLSSLLRISGIPTRYVVGYAYSSVENKLVGHTWVEVLADDGRWVGFDPTWLEAGYIDATHIKTAVRDDANQSEILQYVGSGRITWERDEDAIDLLDYTLANVTALSLQAKDVAFGSYGYARASIAAGSCTIADVNITSCLQKNGAPTLRIQDTRRQLWLCSPQDVYWFYTTADLDRKFIYHCPLAVYDQTGSSAETKVAISGDAQPTTIAIDGPSSVAVKEPLTLTAQAEGDFIFYSPQRGRHAEKTWTLSFDAPGRVAFYLYAGGAFEKKDVLVAEKKEFDLLLRVPANASTGSSFIAVATVTSVLDAPREAAVRAAFSGQQAEQTVLLQPGETRAVEFNLSARAPGRHDVSVSVLGDSISTYSSSLLVYELPKEKSLLDSIISGIVGFFTAIANAIAGLFK